MLMYKTATDWPPFFGWECGFVNYTKWDGQDKEFLSMGKGIRLADCNGLKPIVREWELSGQA